MTNQPAATGLAQAQVQELVTAHESFAPRLLHVIQRDLVIASLMAEGRDANVYPARP